MYYKVLGLEKEPFSTTPDPAFFYMSTEHKAALQRLEIAIRLRRGLSIIFGDVGTGKTTLSRALLQSFRDDENFIFHIILDPKYKSEFQFLTSLIKMFKAEPVFRSTLDYKEALERYLFEKGVNENKTIVLVIDEGQKLTPNFLEVLRILLNYETNEYKLLQLVILAQLELLPRVEKQRNFKDRISLKYTINPLDEEDTCKMINFRLKQAGFNSNKNLFTEEAMRKIYEHAQGYPRRITTLCHDALEVVVMKEKDIIDVEIINELVNRGMK